jgi:hypothetical protein
MRYEDITKFEEEELDDLINEFIEKHSNEWEEFVNEKYEQNQQNDIDWDMEYERIRDLKIENKLNGDKK